MTDNFSVKKVLIKETPPDYFFKPSVEKNDNIKVFDFGHLKEDYLSPFSAGNLTDAKNKQEKPYSKSKVVSVLTKELANTEPNKKSKDEIIKGVNSIDEKNFKDILETFEKVPTGKSLLDLIQNSKQLTTEEKKECLKHIVEKGKTSANKNNQYSSDVVSNIDKLLESYSDSTKNIDKLRLTADVRKLSSRSDTLKVKVPAVNGLVDKPYQQGNTGDCWLLAGINAIACTPEGKKLIDNMVSYDEKTKVTTVTLKTGGESYKITESELKGNNSFAKGDGDVRAIEIAMDRLIRQRGLFGRADIKGNPTNVGLQLLTGSQNTTFIKDDTKAIDKALDKIAKEDSKNRKTAATTAILGIKDASSIKVKDGMGEADLYPNHAYAVADVDSRNVYLVNPHDTSKTITIDRSTYLSYFNNLSFIEL